MPDQNHEPPSHQQEMTTASATSAARYPAGPSSGRSHGEASAPGVAEALGHQGASEQETAVAEPPLLVRAADEAALYRVARRRRRDRVQRRARVDVRYSEAEKNAITVKARSLNIAAAHLVGAVVMAYLDDGRPLPGHRTLLDDHIDELTALRSQVAKLGNNVNQIARILNSGGSPQAVDTAVLAQAEQLLGAVRAAVADIDAASYRAATAKGAA
ncbi:MobC family plasmid mobilization relaxosome protein [Streptomyces sp. NBC_01262]